MNKHILSMLALAVLVAGCRTAHMPIPEALATSEPWVVQGRQGWKIREHLRFGPYEAAEIDRSWTRGSDLQVRSYEGNRRRQQYTFVLREREADRWDVTCEAALRRHMLHVPAVEVAVQDASALACRLQSIDHPDEVWTLALTEAHERPLEGALAGDAGRLDVRGTRQLQKSRPAANTTGYEVRAAGRPVAAVEVVNAGAVWLDGAAPAEQRDLLSATAAALLLLEDLRAHLEEDR